MLMNKYDQQFISIFPDIILLLMKSISWKFIAISSLFTYIFFIINDGILYTLFFIIITLISKNLSFGVLIGWFTVSFLVFLFFTYPEYGHFTETYLQSLSRNSNETVEKIHNRIPDLFSKKIFLSFLYGYYGALFGAFFGWIGSKIFKLRIIY